MKKKKLSWLILYSLLFLWCLPSVAHAEHPARVIMGFYSKELPGKSTIEPYIVSILALNEVENARHLPEVREFLLWYLNRLNYPDIYGLNGTIYVYTVEAGRERPTNQYDSVDGYAGLFLHLLNRYVAKSGDVQILQMNWGKIEDIANLIPLMQDRDGLTWAHPRHRAKYLMDNSETYGGINAYLELRSLVGKNHSSQYYLIGQAIKGGIFLELYEAEEAIFAWAVVENKIQSRSSWQTFYPDAFAQLFPVYYGVLADSTELRQCLWDRFNEQYADKINSFPVEQQIIYNLTRKKMEGL